MEGEKKDNPPHLAMYNSAVSIPPSSQKISLFTEAGGYLSSTSSPKAAVYTNLMNDPRCSPSNRSGTPSSGNASLQMKLGAPKLTTGDVYEFHSSPEEDNAPASSSGFFLTSSASANVLQTKTINAGIQNTESSQPPQKRIKTAILAKKLLAAAADSNIIDPIGLATFNSPQSHLGEREEHEPCALFEYVQKEDFDEEEAGDGYIEEVDEEGEERSDEERGREEGVQELGREYSSTSALLQEQKKVPPLRISLLKTPSEEGADAAAQLASPIRKSRVGGRVTGRKSVHGSKNDLQRVTRSRGRQIMTNEDDSTLAALRRKRRFRTTGGIEESEAVGGLLEEEDAMSSTAEEGLAEEEALVLGGEDERSEENSINMMESENVAGGETSEGERSHQQLSLAASILSKNSLEQSVAFETMVREKWASRYKEHLEQVTEKVERSSLSPSCPTENGKDSFSFYENISTKGWPEQLQKLHTEQIKRSREMAEEHCCDRERIRRMAQQEIARGTEAQIKRKAMEGEGKQRGQLMTIVSLLRDSECYDPGVFVDDLSSMRHQIPNQSLIAKLQQRFNYLVNITRNRHSMEATVLFENHKAEWNRALQRIVRENERQHLLKGSLEGKKQINVPVECRSESVVPAVKVVDISLPSLSNQLIHSQLE